APDDADELTRLLRLLLAGRGRETHPVTAAFRSPHDRDALLAFSGDGKRLLAAGLRRKSFRAWDLQSGKAVVDLQKAFGELDGRSYAAWPVRFNPDGSLLVCASGGGSGADHAAPPIAYEFLETATGRRVGLVEGQGELRFHGFTPDGKAFLMEHLKEKALHLWDTATLKPRDGVIPLPEAKKPHLGLVVLSRDGTKLLLGVDDLALAEPPRDTRLWDLET